MAMQPMQPPDPAESQAEQAPQRSVLRIALWLVVLSLSALFATLYLILLAVQNDNVALQNDLAGLQQTLSSDPPISPEEQALRETLAEVREQTRAIETTYPLLAAGHVNWPAAMVAVGNYDESQLAILSVAQADNLLTLNGRAQDETAVIGYARLLEEADWVARVQVQSITLVIVPTPTPPPTARPAAADAPTLTPSPPPATTGPQRYVEFTILVELARGGLARQIAD